MVVRVPTIEVLLYLIGPNRAHGNALQKFFAVSQRSLGSEFTVSIWSTSAGLLIPKKVFENVDFCWSQRRQSFYNSQSSIWHLFNARWRKTLLDSNKWLLLLPETRTWRWFGCSNISFKSLSIFIRIHELRCNRNVTCFIKKTSWRLPLLTNWIKHWKFYSPGSWFGESTKVIRLKIKAIFLCLKMWWELFYFCFWSFSQSIGQEWRLGTRFWTWAWSVICSLDLCCPHKPMSSKR